MLRLRGGQRRLLIYVFRELANFGVLSLLFGQFVSERPFSVGLAVTSITLWTILIVFAFWLAAQEAE